MLSKYQEEEYEMWQPFPTDAFGSNFPPHRARILECFHKQAELCEQFEPLTQFIWCSTNISCRDHRHHGPDLSSQIYSRRPASSSTAPAPRRAVTQVADQLARPPAVLSGACGNAAPANPHTSYRVLFCSSTAPSGVVSYPPPDSTIRSLTMSRGLQHPSC